MTSARPTTDALGTHRLWTLVILLLIVFIGIALSFRGRGERLQRFHDFNDPATSSALRPEIGFFGIDRVLGRSRSGHLIQIPLPKHKAAKPPRARSEFLTGMTSAQYLQLIKQCLAIGHGGVKNVLLYYWGEDANSKLVQGQGYSVSGSNLATWNTSQLSELRASGLTPFIALESLDPKDIMSMAARLKDGGYSGQEILVRLAAEPDGSHYTATPEEYRRRFQYASRLIKIVGGSYNINFKVCFTIFCRNDVIFTPNGNAFDYIGMDLFVTPENVDDVRSLIRWVAKTYPDKRLVVPEFGVATAGQRSNNPNDCATIAWAERATSLILSDVRENFSGRVVSITPYDVDARDRIQNRVWSWVWSPEMHQQLLSYTFNPHRMDARI